MNKDLSLVALSSYLRALGFSECANLTLAPLTGGQSNPTFLVTADGFRCVLRKKPSGHLVASAHAIDREYRVMAALQAAAWRQ